MKLEQMRERFRPPPEDRTRIRDPEASHSRRQCTTCSLNGKHGVVAEFVITGEDRLEWFECAAHRNGEPYVRPGHEARRVPLREWLANIGIIELPPGAEAKLLPDGRVVYLDSPSDPTRDQDDEHDMLGRVMR